MVQNKLFSKCGLLRRSAVDRISNHSVLATEPIAVFLGADAIWTDERYMQVRRLRLTHLWCASESTRLLLIAGQSCGSPVPIEAFSP